MTSKSMLPPNVEHRVENLVGIFGSITSPGIQETLHSVPGANLIEVSSLMWSPCRGDDRLLGLGDHRRPGEDLDLDVPDDVVRAPGADLHLGLGRLTQNAATTTYHVEFTHRATIAART